MKNKLFETFDDAVADIPDGACIAMFMWAMTGTPSNLILALHNRGIKNITLISHNIMLCPCAARFLTQDELPTPLLLSERAKKIITGAIFDMRGPASPLIQRQKSGELEIEMTTFGTLSERLRAGGSGIAGFLTRVGIGTVVEHGKQKIVLNGEEYLLETGLRAEYGFVRAYRADKLGNLVYRGSQRGNNPIVAMASDITIAEVDEIVEAGELEPDTIVTPGIFVDRVVKIPRGGIGTLGYARNLLSTILSRKIIV